eukprot:1185506-Prorocentrum_minimum.AAC.3
MTIKGGDTKGTRPVMTKTTASQTVFSLVCVRVDSPLALFLTRLGCAAARSVSARCIVGASAKTRQSLTNVKATFEGQSVAVEVRRSVNPRPEKRPPP